MVELLHVDKCCDSICEHTMLQIKSIFKCHRITGWYRNFDDSTVLI